MEKNPMIQKKKYFAKFRRHFKKIGGLVGVLAFLSLGYWIYSWINPELPSGGRYEMIDKTAGHYVAVKYYTFSGFFVRHYKLKEQVIGEKKITTLSSGSYHISDHQITFHSAKGDDTYPFTNNMVQTHTLPFGGQTYGNIVLGPNTYTYDDTNVDFSKMKKEFIPDMTKLAKKLDKSFYETYVKGLWTLPSGEKDSSGAASTGGTPNTTSINLLLTFSNKKFSNFSAMTAQQTQTALKNAGITYAQNGIASSQISKNTYAVIFFADNTLNHQTGLMIFKDSKTNDAPPMPNLQFVTAIAKK